MSFCCSFHIQLAALPSMLHVKALSPLAGFPGNVILSLASQLSKIWVPPLYVISELVLNRAVHQPEKKDQNETASVQVKICSFEQDNAEAES